MQGKTRHLKSLYYYLATGITLASLAALLLSSSAFEVLLMTIFSLILTKALSDRSLTRILAMFRASSTPEWGLPSNSNPKLEL